MQNKHAAIMRRLSDPDFQASLVNKSLGLVMGLSALLVIFVIHDVYIWTHPPSPRFFYIDGTHAPVPATPLDSPIVDDLQLLDWTVAAILAPYNVNYHDYPVQLNTAGRKFTSSGWKSFASSYINSGNFEAMKKGMLVCSGQAQRAAVISEAKLVSGALTYRIQLPIVQTCENSQSQNTQKLMLNATVVRTDAGAHPDGLAIDQLVAIAQ